MNKPNFHTKGYLFDYGGTLDTNGDHWGLMLWHAYERQQVPVSEAEFREAYVFAERRLGSHPIIKADFTFKQTLSTKISIELQHLSDQGCLAADSFVIERYHADILTDLYDRVAATTTHSREVLTALRKEAPMVLVSNFYGNIGVVLREFGLDHLFSDVIESAVVGVRKPDPKIYQLGVEALGLDAADVTVVGDSYRKDIVPAKSLGCHTVWMKGEGWQPDDEADTTAADLIIHDLKELL